MLSDDDVFFARGEKYSHAEVKLLAYRTQPCLLVVESLANRFDDVVVLIPPHTAYTHTNKRTRTIHRVLLL